MQQTTAGEVSVNSGGAVVRVAILLSLTAAVALAIAEQMGAPGAALSVAALGLPLAVMAASPIVGGKGSNATISPVAAGWAVMGSLVATVSFLGYPASIYAIGFDALWAGLGLAGGLALAALVLPMVRVAGFASIPQFMVGRYGRITGALAAALIAVAGCLLVASQLAIMGQFGERLFGLPAPVAMLAAAVAVLVVGTTRGRAGMNYASAGLGAVVVIGLVGLATAFAWKRGHNPFEAVAYGGLLVDIAKLEVGLIGQKLADVSNLKRHAAPFLTLDLTSFVGSALTILAGTVALPQLAGPALAVGTPQRTRGALAWALLLTLPFILLAPALAAYAKFAVLHEVSGAIPAANLPEWAADLMRSGFLQICGADVPEAVPGACKSVGGHKGILRLQDLALYPDGVVLVGARIAGLSAVWFVLFAAAAMAAMLGAIGAAAYSVSNALIQTDQSAGPPSRLVFLAAVVVGTSAALAWPKEVAALVLWPFAILAAGLFAPLLLGVFSKRANAIGAAAGMICGLGITVYYLAGTRYGALGFVDTWAGASNASAQGLRKLTLLREAWVSAKGAAKDMAYVALESHARGLANWWGLKPSAAGLLGIPLAFVVTIVVSLVTPRPRWSAPVTHDAVHGE